MTHKFCSILGLAWPSSRMIPQKEYIKKSKEIYSVALKKKNKKNINDNPSYMFHNSRFN
jgi:hypothetical protein